VILVIVLIGCDFLKSAKSDKSKESQFKIVLNFDSYDYNDGLWFSFKINAIRQISVNHSLRQ